VVALDGSRSARRDGVFGRARTQRRAALYWLIFFVYHNLWSDRPLEVPTALRPWVKINPDAPDPGRPIIVDVMFTTYDEEPDLVVSAGLARIAKALRYPASPSRHPAFMSRRRQSAASCAPQLTGGAKGYIYVKAMKFKAGNLRNRGANKAIYYVRLRC
jgi:cellulose synthase (UDP-forming)